ncbi:UPF0605 protein GA14893-like [Drosophila miranda]|uniref:UPF0605 protein GA14893-like n=1 Tax=Drosophila miranda TaxID=7229 RepID=UPI00143F57B6|nr:UPF0605 protein GA14893-like [Drosophila miranda]
MMNDTITPEPHLVPGYTGHCTQNRDREGKTYGKQTHKLLIDLCIYHAPELIVLPIHAKQGLKDYPTEHELKVLRRREDLVDAVYRHPILPGYAGFVPNMASQTGKRYVAAASAGVAQHETLMELYRCENRTLRHRDLLESGKGLFERKLNEHVWHAFDKDSIHYSNEWLIYPAFVSHKHCHLSTPVATMLGQSFSRMARFANHV